MNSLSRFLNDAYVGWIGSAVSCCRPQPEDEKPLRGVEKSMAILHHQPRLIPPPIPEAQDSRTSSLEWASRTRSFASRASSRGSFSVRRKLDSLHGSRRPQIGAPTDFRHIQDSLPRRAEWFRPLELSIYLPNNQLSPILPHLGVDDQFDLPQPALLRTDSGMSFSISRKPLQSHRSVGGRLESTHSSPESITAEFAHPLRPRPSLPESLSTQQLIAALEKALPQTPPVARLRANTDPVHRAQIERVKSYIQENEALERQLRDIENVIEERRSIFLGSRRGSIYAESEEPMPDMRTCDLERMPIPVRPRTAPAIKIPVVAKSSVVAISPFSSLPPPLPLVVPRPPLRKKKSFSSVSNWLFPGEHSRNLSFDSITNKPKPLTSREGFYRCIDLNAPPRSILSVSTVTSSASGSVEAKTVADTETWTPDSSPTQEPRRYELARVKTFGEKTALGLRELQKDEKTAGFQRLSSVGVAF